MAKVTSLTSARMLAIEAASVVSGLVSDGKLILKTRGGDQIDAGSVIGPQGDQGIPGPPGDGPPIGGIMAYVDAEPPLGWTICDGRAHSSQALFDLTGSWNVPDLRARFVVGAGQGPGLSNYPLNSQAGAEVVALTANQSGLRDHGHTASAGGMNTNQAHNHGAWSDGMNVNQAHGHSAWTGTDGGHGHNSSYGNNYQLSSQAQNLEGTVAGPVANTPERHGAPFTAGEHAHAVGIGATDINHVHGIGVHATNIDHVHGVTVNNSGAANAAEAHENRPPYYALTYIVRVGV